MKILNSVEHWQYPNVQTLSVHTKDEHVVVFKEHEGLVANNYQNTTITGFFDSNKKNAFVRMG